MLETKEDILLRNCLADKVEQFRQNINDGRPYVWELRLSMGEFCKIETAIANSIFSHSGDYHHLLSEEYAVIVVIYLAEWYKRFYKGIDTADESKVLSFSTDELKKLYILAKIDSNTFVYNASKNPDKTSYRWLESLQVLGGLAIQAELKRNENDPLLLQLCKIFYGEETDLDELKDRNRAVALKESISRRHSLYHFLNCILCKGKELPFAISDTKDEATGIPQLLHRIQVANKLAKKNKFDFEWIVAYAASHNRMVRHLKVKLKPEEIGGGKKQYIGYDRLMSPEWGIEHPEEVGRICFYLRFKDEDQYLHTSDNSDTPIFKYDNTGSELTGFLSVNKIDENVYTNIPVEHFDKVEMWIKYDITRPDGRNQTLSRMVQVEKVADYMQVYAIPKTSNKFTSKRNSQTATAVIFSTAYHLAKDYMNLPVVFAHFRNGDKCSQNYYWCPINDKVILVGPDGKEILPPFFNRNGLYQVVTKQYIKTIKYKDNYFVLYKYIDTDYDEDEMQEDCIPVLFGRSGLEVRHYATSLSIEGKPVSDYELEWQKNGRYVDWNLEEPKQGAIRLRVTVKDIVFKPQVYYVPFSPSCSEQAPIWRDFEHMRICTALEGVEDIQDDFKKLCDVQEPDTKQLVIGNKNAKILIDVYRPIILRELSQINKKGHKKIVEFCGKDKDLYVPLINCSQFSLRDFSENGVKEYQIKSNSTFYYAFPTFNDPNLSVDNYKCELKASEITKELPLDYLKIYISRVLDIQTELYAWNYMTEPTLIANAKELKEDGIVFQSLISDDSPRHYAQPYIRKAKAGWGGKKTQVNTDPLNCFETVSLHKVYYFLFTPLIKVVKSNSQIKDILFPLMKKREFKLTDSDISNLYRFAVQFHFDWMLLPRILWVSSIEKFAQDEHSRQSCQKAVLDFFSKTPKCTDNKEKTCLSEFLKIYWSFDSYPKVDDIAEKSLQLILDKSDALGKYDNMKDFLKVYDPCRYKFSEMSRAIVITG